MDRRQVGTHGLSGRMMLFVGLMGFLTIFVILVFWWNVIHRPRRERERKVMEEQARKNMALSSHARLERWLTTGESGGSPKPAQVIERAPTSKPNICSDCNQEIPDYDWYEYDKMCSGCYDNLEGV